MPVGEQRAAISSTKELAGVNLAKSPKLLYGAGWGCSGQPTTNIGYMGFQYTVRELQLTRHHP
jgi:hypothetical protein